MQNPQTFTQILHQGKIPLPPQPLSPKPPPKNVVNSTTSSNQNPNMSPQNIQQLLQKDPYLFLLTMQQLIIQNSNLLAKKPTREIAVQTDFSELRLTKKKRRRRRSKKKEQAMESSIVLRPRKKKKRGRPKREIIRDIEEELQEDFYDVLTDVELEVDDFYVQVSDVEDQYNPSLNDKEEQKEDQNTNL